MGQKSVEFLLKAKYEGKANLAALRTDLSSLKSIKTFEEMGRSIRSTNVNIREAKVQVRNLSKAVKAGGGGKELTRQYTTAKRTLVRLVVAQKKHVERLTASGNALKGAGVDTSNLAAEQARLATVTENSSKAVRAATLLNIRPYKDIKAEIKTLGVAYRDLKKSGTASAGDLSRALDSYRDKVRALNKERGLKNPFADAMKTLKVTPFKKVEAEIKSLEHAYKRLGKNSKLSVLDMARAKDQLKQKIWELRASTNGWAKHLDDIQQHWLGVTAVLAGTAMAISGTIRAFAGFDDSMRRVKAVSSASNAEMQTLSDTARNLGGQTKFMAQEVAQGMSELAQSGMGTDEILKTIPHTLNLAAASGMDFKDAADRMTDSMKQFGLGNDQAERMADVLTKGFTGASTSAEQLSLGLTYVGPIARNMGYSLEATVAVLDTMAEAGFKGQRAGTALRGGFARLLKPTKEAQAVLDKYSIQVNDSTGKTRKFADIIEDMSAASMTSAEQIGLFGLEAGPGMSALLNQGADTIRGFEASLLAAGGTAADVAGEMEGGIGGALRSLRSGFGELVLQLGDGLAPLITAIAKSLKFMAEILGSMSAPVKFFVASAAAAVIGLIAWELGLKRLGSALTLAGAKVTTFSAQTTTFSKVAGKAGKAFALFFAWDIGTAIGTWLNQFGIVKKVALGLIYTFERGRLKIKQFWKMLTGGDAEGVERELAVARDTYSSMIAEIDAGKDKGVAAHKKIADAAADSAQSQVDSQVKALNKMGEAYGEYANKVKKLMPGDEGYEGSKAYQSWKAIEGGGNTLDAPEEGMTKDELAAFYRSQKEREEKKTPEIAKEEQKVATDKTKAAERELALGREKRKEETAAARESSKEEEKKLYLEQQAIELREKAEQDKSGDSSVRDDQESQRTGSSGAVNPMLALNKQMEEGAAVQDPVITTPDPVIVEAPTVDATPALTNVFQEYTDRTQAALAKAPWSVKGSDTEETVKAPEFSSAIPEKSSLAAPLENMKQQARDAVAAVPASLAAMTSSSVHNLINKLQTGGSRSASSGSRAGVAVTIPKKIIELRFPGGSLQGGEPDVNAFLSHLEKAGLTA